MATNNFNHDFANGAYKTWPTGPKVLNDRDLLLQIQAFREEATVALASWVRANASRKPNRSISALPALLLFANAENEMAHAKEARRRGLDLPRWRGQPIIRHIARNAKRVVTQATRAID